MSIEVQNITKHFGGHAALRNVSLQVRPGELLALLGPSGSGKTTLLRIIAGLEFADAGQGRVLFDGMDVSTTPAAARKVGFAFQHYALFRHMTVFENIAFGLRVRPRATRPPESRIRERVCELLKLVQLEQYEKRFPSQLSGGQRQRVALARALAVEPKVLLLDEPFGALDARVRKELRRWLRELHDKVHVTSIFVTHDQEEALEVANRVVVMKDGAIEQIGTPDEVYEHPANPFVCEFLGSVNLFRGRIHNGEVEFGDMILPVPGNHPVMDSDLPAVACVRPHEIRVLQKSNGSRGLPAVIRHVNSAGPQVVLELEGAGGEGRIVANLSREETFGLELQVGATVHLELKNFRIFGEDYSI